MRYPLSLVLLFASLLGFANPSGYLYYKRLTTQENQITVNSSSLSGFPILVRITDPDLKQVTYGGKVRSSKGYDIIFTSSDGTTLIPFQLESYDSLTGALVSWVKLPTVSATVNTDFYMFFGNASVTVNLGSKSTWDANYKAVYHLNADIADWTNNLANLTNSATTNFTPGLAADGQRLGSGAFLSRAATAGLQITGDFTLEAWMFPNSLISGSNENIVLSSSSNNNGTSATNLNYCLSIVGSGSSIGTLVFKWQYGNNSDESVTSTQPINNTIVGWHYVTVVRDNTLKEVRFYFDGLQLGAAVSFTNLPTGGSSNSFAIGKNLADPGRSIDAGFDEVRISNSVRNPEWIQAAYNSYKTGSTFISYSPTLSVSQNNFCFCSVNMSGFTQIGTLNSHTYFRSNQKESWQKADSIASSLGGHLVSITSLSENTFLTLNLLLGSAWTGLSDSITEGSFKWSSGETVSYTNWGILQPDNAGNSDYTLFSSLGGLWDDQQNTQQFYIVEFDCLAATSVLANAGPDQNICGTSATLSATAIPASAIGQWSLLSGAGTIANGSNSTSAVTGLGLGLNSFLWKVADGSCATSIDTVVLITDTIKPTITCPLDVDVNTSPGLCTGIANWSLPVFTDNCPGVALSQGAGSPSGSAFPIGVTSIGYKAVDLNGNSSTCSFKVTVTDIENPTITCPGNLIVNVDPGLCGAIVTGISPLSAFDNCSSFSITYLISGATSGSGSNDASGTFFNVGNSQVRYIITDAAGHVVACNFSINVVDNSAPIFTFCPADITVYTNSLSCAAFASWPSPVATDNCSGITVSQSTGLPSGSAFPLGSSGIKYVAIDAGGLSTTCTFNVIVLDTISPTITACPANIIVAAAAGTCVATVNWTAPGVIDNCAGASISQVAGLSSGSAFPLGISTITYKALDASNLSKLCTFTITVVDTSKPTISNCPNNIIVNNSPGFCNAIVNWISPLAIDNCGGATLTQIAGPASGAAFPLGLSSIIYQATDAAGNTANCTFTVTVADNENPIISCPVNKTVSNVLGFCTALVSGIAPLSGTDNCSGSSISYNITGATTSSGTNDASGALFNLGLSQVTYTITDATGNSNSCNFSVNVNALVPTSADAGPNQFVCSSTASTAANTPLVGTGSWSIVSGTGSFANSNSPNTTITGLSLGSNVFRWTISTSPCTSSFADVTIFVDSPPTISSAGTNQTICSNNSVLSGNIPTIGSGNWILVSGLGAITSPGSPSTSVSALGFGNNVFKWTISNGSCPVSESTVTISVDQNPSISNAGANQNSCITSATLAANTPTVGIGAWSIISGSGTFSNSTSPSSTISGLNLGSTVLRWTISNGTCVSSFSDVTIVVNSAPSIANAGVDQMSAATCGATFIALNANNPSSGTGNWSIVSGGAGSFSNSTSPNSIFSGFPNNLYVLRWTISSPCGTSTDDLSVLINLNPSASLAGSDQTLLCGTTTTALAANTPLVGTASWSIVSGVGGSFALNTDPATTFSGTLGTTYVLRWTIANAPCANSSDDVTITFNTNPTTANAGADQTNLCGVTSTTLAANTASVGAGTWSIVSGAGGSFSSTTNPAATFTGTLGTTYVLRWTIANAPCANSSDDVTITFNTNPTTANAGADQTNLCGVTSTTLAANTPTVGAGTWSIVSGAGGSFSSTTNPAATFTGTLGTTYVLRWTIANAPCANSSDDVTITFNTNPTTANAGSNQTICSFNSTLAATIPTIGTGDWSVISGSASFSNSNLPTSTVTGLSIGANVLRWTVSSGACGTTISDVTIFVVENPSISVAGNDQQICASIATLAANSPNVGTGAWSKISGTGTLVNPASPNSQIVGLSSGISVFQWNISNGICPVSSSSLTITVSANPSTANAGLDQSICGNSTSFAATAPTSGSGEWSIISGSGNFVNPNLETTQVSGLSLGSNVFRWTVSNPPCIDSFDEVTIIVSNIPEIANAGLDQTNLCGVTSTALSSNPALIGTTATWSIVGGNGGSFSNPLSPTSAFFGLADSSYVLRWTISSSGCSDSFDEVLVQFKSNPLAANAGLDQNVCENTNTIALAANAPLGATGSWSIFSGNGNFTNNTLENTTLTGFSLGINKYIWTISNSCGSTFDTVTVLVDALPLPANAGVDQTFCASTNTATLNANTATSGTGLWIVASGGGSLSNSNLSNTSVTNLSLGANTLVWSISNGVCPVSSDSITLFLEALPSTAIAGNDTSICTNQFALLGNVPTVGTGSWSIISGNGTLVDSTDATTVVAGLSIGLNSLVWKISNVTCVPQLDTINITVHPIPSISVAGPNQQVCVDSTVLSGNTPLVGIGTWSLISGSGTILNPAIPNTVVKGLSIGNSIFQWSISNGSCAANTSQVTVSVVAPTSAAIAGSDDTICGNTYTLSANPVVVGTGNWSLLSGAGTIINPNSTNTVVTGLGLGKNTFEWKVSSANCFDTFDSVSVTVTSIPVAANAGNDQLNLCGVVTTALAADTINQINGAWSIVSGVGGSFSSTTNPSATFFGLADSTYVLHWTITDVICANSSDDVIIRFNNTTPTANAGVDKTDASTCGITSINLAANTPSNGNTNWTIVSGVGGSVSSNTPNAVFTGVSGNSYALEWSISGSCGVSKDTVLITFNELPSPANAGQDQSICESTSSVQLAAASITDGVGIWSLISGSGIFSNISITNPVLTGLALGNNSFVWTVSNAICTNAVDTITVFVAAQPTTANAGLDQNICIDATSIELNANAAAIGSGQWTSLSSGISYSNNLDPQSFVTGLSVGATSFVWEISTGLQCPASRDTIKITVSALPSIAFAGNDLLVCESTASVNLTASAATIGNGLWTISSGTATFLNSSSENTAVGNLTLGKNELVWTILNGACTASSDTVIIEVSALPTPAVAGPNQQLCESSDTLILVGNTPVIGNGLWTLVSGVATIGSSTNDTTEITAYSVGTTALNWTISNGACSSSDTIDLFVFALPTQANAGSDKSVCNPYALLKADTAYIGTGLWTVASGSTGIVLNPNYDTSAVVAMSQGSNTFFWTVSNGVCNNSIDSVTITVNPAATIANAGPDQSICESETQVFLTANTPVNGVGNWRQIFGSGSIADSTAASTTASGLSLGVNIFSWIIKNGTCSSFDNIKITVNALPTIANAGADQTVCENTSTITLAANSPVVGLGAWSGPGLIADSTLETTSVSALGIGNNTFVWKISNGACAASLDTVLIIVDALPSNANAGVNQTHCINESNLSLAADSVLIGTGLWTTNGSSVIVNSTLHNSEVNTLSSGISTFVWSVSSGICPVSSDTVKIQIDDLPTTSLAGTDQLICASFSVFSANSASTGVGTWSLSAGTGLIANPSAPNSTVSGLAIGLNEFVWTIENGVCGASKDTIKVSVLASVSQASAGSDQSVCTTNPVNSLNAVAPSSGSGLWSSITSGAIVNNPTLPNSTVGNLNLGANSFVWTVSNGLCTESKDTVTILLSDAPSIAVVGGNQTICENATSVSINANSPIVGIGQWSVMQGNGIVLNPLSSVSSITASKGINSFIWTISNGACLASKDTAYVFVDSLAPQSNAGIDQTICENSTSVLLNANAVSFGSASWSSLSAGVNIVSPTSNNSAITGFSTGQNTFVWTTINGVCPANTDTTTINIDATPTSSNAGPDQTLCDTTSSTLLNGNGAIVGSGIWLPILGAGTLVQASNPISGVTGLVSGIATFEWVISNGSCPSSRDTVSILISTSPSAADAGPDQIVCENVGTVLLNAVSPTIGTGVWSLDNGIGVINNTNLPNTSLSGLGVGSNVFRWTVTNGVCKTLSTVTVQVDALPSVADAGQDLSVAAPIANLNASIPTNGIGSWSISQGSGNFDNPNSNSSSIRDLSVGNTVLTWTVSNGTCPSSTDEVQITYLDMQIPNAISPNNDGINDAFVIPGLDFYEDVKLTIYNSWGNIVYHSNRYKNEFIGSNDSGQQLLDDTYYYILQVNNDQEYKGYLIIKK